MCSTPFPSYSPPFLPPSFSLSSSFLPSPPLLPPPPPSVCGDCVDKLTNATTLLITMLNQTVELLPNLTVRIGPQDLIYVDRNATYIGRFLDIWTGDVGTAEVALGLEQGPPLVGLEPPLVELVPPLVELVPPLVQLVPPVVG